MQEHYETRNLFRLQSELIDRKIDMAVSNSIDKVIEHINLVRSELGSEIKNSAAIVVEEFKQIRLDLSRLETKIIALEARMIVVETKLGIVNERQKELRSRFFDYGFKAIWMGFGGAITFVLLHMQLLTK